MNGGSFISPILSLIKWIVESMQRPSPEKVLSHRKSIKKQLVQNLKEHFEYYYGEVIIVDVNRLSSYPKHIFKTEVKGLYHAGLEVYDTRGYIVQNVKKEICKSTNEENPNGIMAQFVNRIPYSNIVDAEWSGTEYAYEPHIYCKFKKGNPYETTICYEPVFDEKQEISYYKPLGKFRPGLKVRMRKLLNWIKY